jgi:hypothetical protein
MLSSRSILSFEEQDPSTAAFEKPDAQIAIAVEPAVLDERDEFQRQRNRMAQGALDSNAHLER